MAPLSCSVQQQDGAEDDVEQREGDDEPVHAGREDLHERHLPDEEREQERHQVRERHRPAGRPPRKWPGRILASRAARLGTPAN